MQHLATTMSVTTWLTSPNQSQKHYAGFVHHAKQQNIPGGHLTLQIHRLHSPTLTSEKLYVTNILMERS